MFRKESLYSVSAMLVIALILLLGAMPQAETQGMAADGVYSFGSGGTGELGLGPTRDTRIPARIQDLGNAQAVEACYQHSLVLMRNGDVYSFGENGAGQLGLGDKENRRVPTKIPGIGRAKAIGAGERHSLIVTENGDVYSFGNNSWGQLGHGDKEERLTPARIAGLTNAKAVAAGLSHSLVLLENGDVYSFGYSGSGQLGQGRRGGINHITPLHIESLGGAKAISAGSNTSLVLLENGEVFAFGGNRYGALGTDAGGETPTRIEGIGPAKAIAAGTGHSLVLLENGDLYSLGQGNSGQLGHGDTEHRDRPTRIATLSDVSMISAGTRHSLAVLDNGEVYSFGLGSGGRLGHGDLTTRTVPTLIEGLPENKVLDIAAGYSHSLVLIVTPPMTIAIDGQYLQTDVPPVIREDTPMVPLRPIFEAMGLVVEYSSDKPGLLHATMGGSDFKIELQDESPFAKVDDKEVNLGIPAILVDDQFFVPAQFVAETLGQDLKWSHRTKIVNIVPRIEPGEIFVGPGDILQQ